MVDIDSSIYSQQQSPDFLGSVEKGLRMSDMLRTRRDQFAKEDKEKAIKAAYDAGIVQNPDGSSGFDQKRTLSALAKIGGPEYVKADAEFKAQDAAKQKSQFETLKMQNEAISGILGSVRDPASWQAGVMKAKAMGIDVSKELGPDGNVIPYDPKHVQGLINQSLSAQQRIDNQFKERELGIRSQELGEKRAEKKEEKEFQLTTPYGLALTKKDADVLKSADEEKKTFDAKIQQMIDLRTKHHGGAVWNREDIARGKQLSKDALLSYKNMAKLGVLSQSDEAIINAIIPEDPLEYSSLVAAVQGQDPIGNNLAKFKADSDKDFQNRLQNRLRNPPKDTPKTPADPEHDEAYQWAIKNQSDPRAKKILELQNITKQDVSANGL